MEVRFEFVDFDSTKSIEDYVLKRFHTLQRRLDARFENADVLLRGVVSAKNPQGQAKRFLAELSVKVPRHRPVFIVKKQAANFRTAVSDALHAMETLLRRDSEKRERSRKTLGKTLKPVRQLKRSQALANAVKS